MSLGELMQQLERMNAAERAEVSRHLQLLRWKEDPETPRRLAAAHARMDAGQKVSQEQFEAMAAKGRERGV
jgi:hypothetical protein